MPKRCIIAIILCALLAGCYDSYSDSYWIDYSYSLNVFSENESLQFQILLPVPINETNETNPGFFENIETVDGDFTFTTNQTIHGPCLSVIGNGNIELDIYFDDDSDTPIESYSNFSMLDDYWPNEDFGFFWVFCSVENISIHLTYHYTYSGPGYEYISHDYMIISMLRIGWQRVPATIYHNDDYSD